MNMRNKLKLAHCLEMATAHKEWLLADGLDGVAPPMLTINHGPGSSAATLDDLRLFWGTEFFNDLIEAAREFKYTQIKLMALCAQFGVTGYAVECLLEEISGQKTGNDVLNAKHNYYATRYNYGRALQLLISDKPAQTLFFVFTAM